MNSLAENLIKRLCGRYLKDFSAANVQIGVTGTITVRDVQVNVEEFKNFQLPVHLVSILLGTMTIDLPILVGSNFDIAISDVIILSDEAVSTETDIGLCDEQTIHRALQMWIGAFYFSLAAEGDMKMVTSSDVDYTFGMLNRFKLTLTNVHFRIEDKFKSHISQQSGETICSGLIVRSAEVRSPTYEERAADEASIENTWARLQHPRAIALIKLVNFKFDIYCTREPSVVGQLVGRVNVETLREICRPRSSGAIISGATLSIKLNVAYQKQSQVFGPVTVTVAASPIDVTITDEQAGYITTVTAALVRHIDKVRLTSRLKLCAQIDDRKMRARERWALIRESIAIDWLKYTASFEDGSIRWRSWFLQWRMAARYVALRELLIYHVGYEPVYDDTGSIVSYSISESLLCTHVQPGRKTGDDSDDSTILAFADKRYLGTGSFSSAIVTAAQAIVTQQIERNSSPLTSSEGFIDPISMSPTTVRALYALQLELDTKLSVDVSARCRLWAEEKYRLKCAASKVGRDDDHDDSYQEEIDESAASKDDLVLLFSVLDAVNLKASFGANKIESYCSMRLDGSATLTTTYETVNNKIAKCNSKGVTFTDWGDVFTVPVPKEDRLFDSSAKYRDVSALLECNSRGIFMPSFGKALVPLRELMRPALEDITLSCVDNYPITTHVLAMKSLSGNIFSTENLTDKMAALPEDPDAVRIRVMCLVSSSSRKSLQSNHLRLSKRVAEAIEERRDLNERQRQLEEREAVADDEDEMFILDHNVSTVKDLRLFVKIPRVTASVQLSFLGAQGEVVAPVNIPMCLLKVHDIAAEAVASNNPWIINASASMKSFRLSQLYSDDTKKKGRRPPPLLALPAVSASAKITQISSMGRFLSGLLDGSCFDWSVSINSFPYRVAINSSSFMAKKDDSVSTIWKSYRVLSHLWQPRTDWSSGHAFGSLGDRRPPQRRPEAAYRLGTQYTTYPKHLNCLTEVTSAVRRVKARSAIASDDNFQTSKVSFKTQTRSLDLEIVCRPADSAIGESDLLTDDELDYVSSSDEEPVELPAASVRNNVLYDAMNTTTGVLTFGLIGGQQRNPPAKVHEEKEKASAENKGPSRSDMMHEVRKLEARIRYLEAELEIAKK